MPAYITVAVDPVAFQEKVNSVFRNSPIAAEFQGGKITIKGLDFMKLVEVVRDAVSSVEIVKQNLIAEIYPEGQPDNVKFTPDLCVRVAVDLVFSIVKFGGPLGWVISSFGRPLVIAMIEAVLTGLKGRDWLMTAKQTLKLV